MSAGVGSLAQAGVAGEHSATSALATAGTAHLAEFTVAP